MCPLIYIIIVIVRELLGAALQLMTTLHTLVHGFVLYYYSTHAYYNRQGGFFGVDDQGARI